MSKGSAITLNKKNKSYQDHEGGLTISLCGHNTSRSSKKFVPLC